MAVVVVCLMVMVGSAVPSIAPASSRVGSGAAEDRAKNEALGHGKSAQPNPDSDGTEEECLHCGSKSCNQQDAKRQGRLHCKDCLWFGESQEIVRNKKAGQFILEPGLSLLVHVVLVALN